MNTPSTMLSPQPSASDQTVVLSPVEDLVCRADDRFDGAGRVAVLLRLDGCVEADILEPALLRLQARHPKLRAAIAVGADQRRRYHLQARPSPIPFEIRDYDGPEFPWREEARRQLQAPMAPPSGLLARVAVLRARAHGRSDLVIVAHHAVADGVSAIALAHELLSEYDSIARGVTAEPPPSLPLVSVARARQTGTLLQRARLLCRLVRLWRDEHRLAWTGLPQAPDVVPYSQWEHWVLSKQDTLALVRRCRKEQVSISGVLCAAALCAVMDCLGLPEGRFKCKFPVDVRASLSGPAGSVGPQDLGCFVSVLQQFYRVQQPLSLWTIARRAHEDLQQFVAAGGPEFVYNAASSVRKLKERTRFKRGTLLVTNYGVAALRQQYGNLKPRACTLVFKNDVVGPSLILEALVLGQELNLGLSAFDLDPAVWGAYQAAVRGHLNAAIGREASSALAQTPAAASG